MLILRIGLLALGALGMLDSLLISTRSNLNLGVVLPALLGLPLLLAGLFLPQLSRWMQAGFGALCKWILVGGYALVILAFLVTALLIRSAAGQTVPADADALIVLGAGLRGERPTLVLAHRLDAAAAYLEENPKCIAVLSGGQGEGETISEALAMSRYLGARGIAQERMLLEDRSVNTQENFAFSRELIRERIGEDAEIVFVTTDFHVYRAQRVAAKQGIALKGLSATDVWYIRPNNVLRECVAVWVYWLRGRI